MEEAGRHYDEFIDNSDFSVASVLGELEAEDPLKNVDIKQLQQQYGFAKKQVDEEEDEEDEEEEEYDEGYESEAYESDVEKIVK